MNSTAKAELNEGGTVTSIDRSLLATASDPPSSILIEDVRPMVDCGRYPVKREVGDRLAVTADIFREGHDKIAAVVRYRRIADPIWTETDMRYVDNDRWCASFDLTENTRYVYKVEAAPDDFESWRDEVAKKTAAGLDVTSELIEGQRLVSDAAGRAGSSDRAILERESALAARATGQADAVATLLGPELAIVMRRNRSRTLAATSQELTVMVDRVAARYAAWYSMFPRSAGAVPGQSATFDDVITQLPRIRSMGFDVLYFTPIHPIGRTKRKGPNNTLNSGPDDPGVPYAIGSEDGGHEAIHPDLGTVEDFRRLVSAAAEHGMELALDIAINASPDHPWAKEHPDWFFVRPDGTIKYSENPPKKYEDIYPINFGGATWKDLWHELKRMLLYCVDLGVKTFRVDNPHTKPTIFWEWVIAEVHKDHPDVIFLSEAFTRPKVMKALAKAGFAQSYTYFTWRNFKREMTEYLTELTQTDVAEYMRGNLFTNTHDILPAILQEGGRPAFKMRVALAATLSSVYGIYSGFELCENTPVPGKEEYLHSEKYEYKVWDWNRPGNISEYISAINLMRQNHPALQEYDNLRFYWADDENVICYGKSTPDGTDRVVVAVNMDPFQTRETLIHLPIADFGIGSDEQYRATDILTGETNIWTGGTQHIRLDPNDDPARFWSIQRFPHVAFAEPCF